LAKLGSWTTRPDDEGRVCLGGGGGGWGENCGVYGPNWVNQIVLPPNSTPTALAHDSPKVGRQGVRAGVACVCPRADVRPWRAYVRRENERK